jgi:glycosyltransferase involved in cell wall biosynthesis
LENIKPKISIIVPAKNAVLTLAKCIGSLKALDYQDFEIIIVDDGSTDTTRDIIKGFSGVTLITTGGVGPSKARNLGIEKATGEYIAFTDADCVVEKNWLSELLNGFTLTPIPYSLSSVVAVGGDQKSPDDDSAFGKTVHGFLKAIGFVADYVKSGGGMPVETKHNPSCNVMYKTEVLKQSGGFLENLWPGEDLELDYRLKKKGCTFLYNPGAVVYHYRTSDMKGFKRMMFSYGRVQALLARMYGPFRFIHFVPVFVLTAIVLSLTLPLIVLVLSAAFLFIGWSYMAMKSKSIKVGFIYLRLLIVTLVYWNLGFARGLTAKIPPRA